MPRHAIPARLLAPYPLARFLSQVWGEEPLLVRGSARRHARLFSWQTLNDLLATHRLEPPRLRLVQSGAVLLDLQSFLQYRPGRDRRQRASLDVPRLNTLLARGATLILNEVQDMHPPLAALTRGFAQLFAAEPNVNLYAAFGKQQGFGPHWDDHDVFVLQIAGEKRWRLYGTNRRYPLFRDVRPNERRPVRPIARHRLQPGDLLYVPRGCWHDAVGTGDPTLHLTLGIPPCTAVDYLRWLGDDLSAVESMRRNVPLFDAKRRKQWLTQVQAAVARRLDAAALERFLEERRANLQSNTRPSLPHALQDASALARSDHLQWTGFAHSIRAAGKALAVGSGGHEYVFDRAASALIEQLLTGEPISYGQLLNAHARKLGAGRVRRFVGELLREHFISVVPHG
jgi:ribosomal protein L16 Arg81 hydroxylase